MPDSALQCITFSRLKAISQSADNGLDALEKIVFKSLQTELDMVLYDEVYFDGEDECRRFGVLSDDVMVSAMFGELL